MIDRIAVSTIKKKNLTARIGIFPVTMIPSPPLKLQISNIVTLLRIYRENVKVNKKHCSPFIIFHAPRSRAWQSHIYFELISYHFYFSGNFRSSWISDSGWRSGKHDCLEDITEWFHKRGKGVMGLWEMGR